MSAHRVTRYLLGNKCDLCEMVDAESNQRGLGYVAAGDYDDLADQLTECKARAVERLVHYCVCCPEEETPRDGCDCVCCTTVRLNRELAEAREWNSAVHKAMTDWFTCPPELLDEPLRDKVFRDLWERKP